MRWVFRVVREALRGACCDTLSEQGGGEAGAGLSKPLDYGIGIVLRGDSRA